MADNQNSKNGEIGAPSNGMNQEENLQRIPPTPPPIRPRSEVFSEEKPESAVPTGDVFIRTMEEDIKAPKPEEVLPPEEGKEIEIKPETAVLFPPSEAPKLAELPELESPKKSIWLFIIGGIIIAGVSFVLGYFVIFPLVFPAKEAITILEKQLVSTPSVEEVKPPKVEHISPFVIQPAETSKINLSQVTFLDISLALQTEAAKKIADGSIKEIAILDQNDSQVSYEDFIAQFLTGADKKQLDQWFENDFAAYLYYDRNGVWPGYIAKIKRNPSLQSVLENASNVANFYLITPGTLSAFKDGKVNNYVTRYATGSRAGAAFNYGIFKDYFVISASFDGLKAAVKSLSL